MPWLPDISTGKALMTSIVGSDSNGIVMPRVSENVLRISLESYQIATTMSPCAPKSAFAALSSTN